MGSNGALDFAVLSNNGTLAAVPWGAMTWNAANGVATLPLTQAQFATLPTFTTTNWSNLLTNPAFTQRINNTFINFRDVNGNAIFNNAMVNGVNRVGMRTNNSTQNMPAGRAGNQPNQTNTQPNQTNPQQPNQPGPRQARRIPAGRPRRLRPSLRDPAGAPPKIPPR